MIDKKELEKVQTELINALVFAKMAYKDEPRRIAEINLINGLYEYTVTTGEIYPGTDEVIALWNSRMTDAPFDQITQRSRQLKALEELIESAEGAPPETFLVFSEWWGALKKWEELPGEASFVLSGDLSLADRRRTMVFIGHEIGTPSDEAQ